MPPLRALPALVLAVAGLLLLLQLAAGQGAAAPSTPGEAVNSLLLRTTPGKISMTQLSQTSFMDRVARRYTIIGGDPSSVSALLLAQQRWRRGGDGVTSSRDQPAKTLDPLDCQPMYKIRRTETHWFHHRAYEQSLCFLACFDYPACTSTAPLVRTDATPSGWGLLLRCGLKGARDNATDIVELRGRRGDGSSAAVCRNAVDRSGGLPGVEVVNAPPPPSPPGGEARALKRARVEAFARSGRAHDEELVMFVHDLWASWAMPMLHFRPLYGAPGTQVLVTPTGDKLLQYAQALSGDAAMQGVLRRLALPAAEPHVVDALWVAAPDTSKGTYIQAAYVVQRPDMDSRWMGFFTYGSAESMWQHFVTVNGICEEMLWSLAEVGRAWNASRVARRAPPNCTYADVNASVTAMADEDWAGHGTAVFSKAARERMASRCPIILDQRMPGEQDTLNNSVPWVVTGCNREAAFVLNIWGDSNVCQGGNLFVTPVAEATLVTGTRSDTYLDAWSVYSTALRQPAAARAALLVDAPGAAPAAAAGGSPRAAAAPATDYYALLDPAMQCAMQPFEEYQAWVLRQAQRAVESAALVDPAQGSITVGLMQVVIASLTAIMLWTKDAHDTVLKWYDRARACVRRRAKPAAKPGGGCACCPSQQREHLAVLGAARFLAAIFIVAPAVFSFISVTSQVGTTLVDGYPSLTFSRGRPERPPCHNGRFGGLAFGVEETAVLTIEVQTWAVVLVCVMSVLLVLGTTLGIVVHEALLQQQEASAAAARATEAV